MSQTGSKVYITNDGCKKFFATNHTRLLFLLCIALYTARVLNIRIIAKSITTLDSRSLAIFRITLGIFLVWLFYKNFTDTPVWFSPYGLTPQEITNKFTTGDFRWNWNYLFIVDSAYISYTLALIGSALSIALIVGFKTRWIVPIIWLIVLSFMFRNIFITDGAYWLLSLTIFWAMFIPLESSWSYDHKATMVRPQSYIANLGFILSISCVYLFSAFHKTNPAWSQDFTAVWLAMTNHLANPIGNWLASHSNLLLLLTKLIVWLEYTIGALLVFGKYFRLIGALAIIALHFGISFTLHLEIFPWIGTISAIALLPTEAWNILPIYTKKTEKKYEKRTKLTFIKNSILFSIICIIIGLNIDAIYTKKRIINNNIEKTFVSFGLLQKWWMFNNQSTIRHYMIFTGWKGGDTYINLNEWLWNKDAKVMNGIQLEEWYASTPPNNLQKRFGTMRWARFYSVIESNEEARLAATKSICNSWNTQKNDTINMVLYRIAFQKRTFPSTEFTPIELWTIAEDTCPSS